MDRGNFQLEGWVFKDSVNTVISDSTPQVLHKGFITVYALLQRYTIIHQNAGYY